MSRSKKKKAKKHIKEQYEKAFSGQLVEPWFKGKFRRALALSKNDVLLRFADFLVKRSGNDTAKPKNKAEFIVALLPGATDQEFFDWLLAGLQGRVSFSPERTKAALGAKKSPTTPRRLKSKKIKKARQSFYRSEVWQEMRKLVLARYGYRCMRGIDCKGPMHVDHIKPRSKFPKLELDFNNLQVLCESCNNWKSNIYYTDFRPKESKATKASATDVPQ